MSTKNVSKCSYYGKVLLDLTGDTVTTSTLKKGATAHDATGTKITGTLTIPESQTKTMDLNMALGDQVVKPDSGKVLSQVIVKKPSTFTAENIKKDVNIGGVVGTLESGGGGTAIGNVWLLNADAKFPIDMTSTFFGTFSSNNTTYTSISAKGKFDYDLYYGRTIVGTLSFEVQAVGGSVYKATSWKDNLYRVVAFEETPSGDLLTWLKSNATMLGAGSGGRSGAGETTSY